VNGIAANFSFAATLGKNAWWRGLLVWMFTATAAFVATLPMLAVLSSAESVQQRGFNASNFVPEAVGLSPSAYLALVLIPFAVALVALLLAVRRLHRRPLNTLVTGGLRNRPRYWRIVLGAGTWGLLLALVELLRYMWRPSSYVFSFDPSTFYPALAVLLLLIPLQIAFEEIAVRGYLHQQVTYRTGRPWIGLVISSTVFAMLHGLNPEVNLLGWDVMGLYYVSVGGFLAILSILDNGLELALGVHLATNLYATAGVHMTGSALPTPSIITTEAGDGWVVLALFLLQAFIFLAAFAKTSHWTPAAFLHPITPPQL